MKSTISQLEYLRSQGIKVNYEITAFLTGGLTETHYCETKEGAEECEMLMADRNEVYAVAVKTLRN